MWNKRDETKEYDFPNARENCLAGDAFVEGKTTVYNRILLLVYKSAVCFHGFKSFYNLNLFTVKPTKTSKTLSPELIEKIKIRMKNTKF